MHCATNNSNKNTRKFGGWERASFAAQTESLLCGKFSTARLEVLPNLRHAGVFQMSTMVNLGIGFQIKSLWLVQALNLTRRWAFALQLHNVRGIYKFQLAGRWRESKKMSCHAILKNLYEPKMDVILTISFKITAEIEITKQMFCVLSYFADEDVYRRFEKHNILCSFIHSLPWNICLLCSFFC